MSKALFAAGLGAVAVASSGRRKGLAERYAEGEAGVGRVTGFDPLAAREDWVGTSLAQKLVLMERNGAWPERSATQGWMPVATLDDLDVVRRQWARNVAEYAPTPLPWYGGTVYLPSDAAEGHSINPATSLDRRMAEFRELVEGRTGIDAGPVEGAGQAPLSALAREPEDALVTFEESEVFWKGIVAVAADLAAVESFDPSRWRFAGEALREAWDEWPATFAEYTYRAAAWTARQAGAVVGAIAGGLLSSPLLLAGLGAAAVALYRMTR